MKLVFLLMSIAAVCSAESHSKKPRNVVNVSTSPNRRWPFKMIFYLIHGSFPADIQSRIRDALREITDNTKANNRQCFNFIERVGLNMFEANYFYIHPNTDENSCISDVGMQGGQQNIYINETCWSKSQIMYHILHAVGLWDEHIRPDRDTYVTVHWDNIEQGQRDMFRKLSDADTSLFGLPYDYDSLMHIGPYKYAEDSNRPTLSVKTQGKIIGQSVAMTVNDVKKVQMLYECSIDISNVAPPERLVDCSFEKNICNMTNDPAASLSWTRINTPSADKRGPQADHTNGKGFYMFATTVGNTNRIARMVSPTLPPGQYCVILFYFMYGNDTGNLEVVASDIEGSRVITNLHSQQLTSWKESRTNFNSRLSWVLEVSAHIGPRQTTGIAMDDVTVYRGPCL